MTDVQLARITKLVDMFDQAVTECLNAQIVSPVDATILRESVNCLEEGYREWLQVPSSLALAVRALSHVLGELIVHKELDLRPWSARRSPGMRLLERAEEGAARALPGPGEHVRQSAPDEHRGAFIDYRCQRIRLRLH